MKAERGRKNIANRMAVERQIERLDVALPDRKVGWSARGMASRARPHSALFSGSTSLPLRPFASQHRSNRFARKLFRLLKGSVIECLRFWISKLPLCGASRGSESRLRLGQCIPDRRSLLRVQVDLARAQPRLPAASSRLLSVRIRLRTESCCTLWQCVYDQRKPPMNSEARVDLVICTSSSPRKQRMQRPFGNGYSIPPA